jgi:hypothetical protein
MSTHVYTQCKQVTKSIGSATILISREIPPCRCGEAFVDGDSEPSNYSADMHLSVHVKCLAQATARF